MIPLPAIPPALLVRALVVVIVLGATFATGYIHGLRSGMERFNDYVAEQAKLAVKVITKQGQATERVVIRYVKVKGETEVITRTVEKEVLSYAQENRGACLTEHWRLLHNAAAANTLPEPAPGTDAASRAPAAAAALATITANYAACNRTADRLEALQDWIREQQGALGAERPP